MEHDGFIDTYAALPVERFDEAADDAKQQYGGQRQSANNTALPAYLPAGLPSCLLAYLLVRPVHSAHFPTLCFPRCVVCLCSAAESASSSAPIVSAHNLHKTYLLGVEGVPALRGVNLNIAAGEFIMILGTSGGGKVSFTLAIATPHASSAYRSRPLTDVYAPALCCPQDVAAQHHRHHRQAHQGRDHHMRAAHHLHHH